MSTVIRVENLSKYYRLGLIGGKTLHDDLNRWWARVRKQPDPLLKIGQEDRQNGNGEYIWALRDMNFEAQLGYPVFGKGKIVGIPSALLRTGIGRNPAKREQGHPAHDSLTHYRAHPGIGINSDFEVCIFGSAHPMFRSAHQDAVFRSHRVWGNLSCR